MSMPSGDYWFCLRHHAVETGEECGPADRLGPYPTAEEAERALEKVHERNEDWDNDPNWNDPPLDGHSPASGPVV